tara:strand:+ start:604 stop:1002 length:399 start_codon:yes stop_codon:yes gene_type:complete
MKNLAYISFVGQVLLPENIEELNSKYSVETYTEEILVRNRETGYDEDNNKVEIDNDYWSTKKEKTGFRNDLDYNDVDGKDSLTVYIAVIDSNTGHLVADCPAGNWTESCFVQLQNGNLKKVTGNTNPISQLG